MKDELTRAALAFAELLERENAALVRTDLSGAAALLVEKQRLAAVLASAQIGPDATLSPETGRRLNAPIEENRILLERGIAVQGRLIELIADAMQQTFAAPRYTAHGASRHDPPAIPFALSSRA